jgi:hypothetical protein
MYKPMSVPAQPNRGKGGESLSSSIAQQKPQGGSPRDVGPGASKLMCQDIKGPGAGTKGESGKVRSVPPRCC